MAVLFGQSLTLPESGYATVSSAGVKMQDGRTESIKGKQKPHIKQNKKLNKPHRRKKNAGCGKQYSRERVR